MAQDESEILEELREQFIYGEQEWDDIRDAGDRAVRALAGDIWDPDERKEREDKNRPCLSLDELTQYVNQLINDIRSSKRGIQVTPMGSGANDKTAEFRQGLMRQIEYESNAQQAAYIVMAENMVNRGYGFLRIKPDYVSDRSFEQRLLLEPIPDPNTITIDPGIVRTDGKDMRWAFQRETRSIKEFGREFPYAQIRSFGDEQRQKVGKQWISGERITIANYWRIEPERKKLLLIQLPGMAQAVPVFEDQLEDVKQAAEIAEIPAEAIKKTRMVDVPRVRQYLTNGLEILQPEGQEELYVQLPGKSIPIVPCFGKVLYVRDAGTTKRVMLGLIHLAIDPAMLYSYYRTQQAEMAAMIPKSPVVGYKGQFAGVEADWESAPHQPIAFLEAHGTTNQTPPGELLPLPQRLAYEAGQHLQALELCAEGARRAIQAAVGQMGLPTAAQRRNEKSGVALEKIDSEQQRGSFHFVDHYNESITRSAQILEEQIPTYYDTARDVTIRQDDDTPSKVRINDPEAKEHIQVEAADHDVTLSTGPSFESQREAAADFIDHLAQNEMIFSRIGDLLVKLKMLGPIGDEIAARITPPEFRKQPGMENVPPEVQAMLGQANHKIQELTQQATQMAEELRTEQVKAQAVEKIETMKIDFQREKLAIESETKISVAELGAKVDRLQLFLEERSRIGIQDHEAEEARRNRAHDVGQAVLEHTQNAAAAAQAHNQALEQQQQGQAHALEQIAAQPQPEAGV